MKGNQMKLRQRKKHFYKHLLGESLFWNSIFWTNWKRKPLVFLEKRTKQTHPLSYRTGSDTVYRCHRMDKRKNKST
jgi:hypothetical protein